MKENLQETIEQLVDLLLPELTPFEATVYLFFLRHSLLKGEQDIRIGQRTLARAWLSPRDAESTSRSHILRTVKGLAEKGAIRIGDTNREGTLYSILVPREIGSVKEKLSIVIDPIEEDYFKNPEKRKEIFERDRYVCHYCGDQLSEDNATLDHLIPQFMGGKHSKANLRTSCLICNSIKSGKSYDEAAPLLLKRIQELREKGKER